MAGVTPTPSSSPRELIRQWQELLKKKADEVDLLATLGAPDDTDSTDPYYTSFSHGFRDQFGDWVREYRQFIREIINKNMLISSRYRTEWQSIRDLAERTNHELQQAMAKWDKFIRPPGTYRPTYDFGGIREIYRQFQEAATSSNDIVAMTQGQGIYSQAQLQEPHVVRLRGYQGRVLRNQTRGDGDCLYHALYGATSQIDPQVLKRNRVRNGHSLKFLIKQLMQLDLANKNFRAPWIEVWLRTEDNARGLSVPQLRSSRGAQQILQAYIDKVGTVYGGEIEVAVWAQRSKIDFDTAIRDPSDPQSYAIQSRTNINPKGRRGTLAFADNHYEYLTFPDADAAAFDPTIASGFPPPFSSSASPSSSSSAAAVMAPPSPSIPVPTGTDVIEIIEDDPPAVTIKKNRKTKTRASSSSSGTANGFNFATPSLVTWNITPDDLTKKEREQYNSFKNKTLFRWMDKQREQALQEIERIQEAEGSGPDADPMYRIRSLRDVLRFDYNSVSTKDSQYAEQLLKVYPMWAVPQYLTYVNNKMKTYLSKEDPVLPWAILRKMTADDRDLPSRVDLAGEFYPESMRNPLQRDIVYPLPYMGRVLQWDVLERAFNLYTNEEERLRFGKLTRGGGMVDLMIPIQPDADALAEKKQLNKWNEIRGYLPGELFGNKHFKAHFFGHLGVPLGQWPVASSSSMDEDSDDDIVELTGPSTSSTPVLVDVDENEEEDDGLEELRDVMGLLDSAGGAGAQAMDDTSEPVFTQPSGEDFDLFDPPALSGISEMPIPSSQATQEDDIDLLNPPSLGSPASAVASIASERQRQTRRYVAPMDPGVRKYVTHQYNKILKNLKVMQDHINRDLEGGYYENYTNALATYTAELQQLRKPGGQDYDLANKRKFIIEQIKDLKRRGKEWAKRFPPDTQMGEEPKKSEERLQAERDEDARMYNAGERIPKVLGKRLYSQTDVEEAILNEEPEAIVDDPGAFEIADRSGVETQAQDIPSSSNQRIQLRRDIQDLRNDWRDFVQIPPGVSEEVFNRRQGLRSTGKIAQENAQYMAVELQFARDLDQLMAQSIDETNFASIVQKMKDMNHQIQTHGTHWTPGIKQIWNRAVQQIRQTQGTLLGPAARTRRKQQATTQDIELGVAEDETLEKWLTPNLLAGQGRLRAWMDDFSKQTNHKFDKTLTNIFSRLLHLGRDMRQGSQTDFKGRATNVSADIYQFRNIEANVPVQTRALFHQITAFMDQQVKNIVGRRVKYDMKQAGLLDEHGFPIEESEGGSRDSDISDVGDGDGDITGPQPSSLITGEDDEDRGENYHSNPDTSTTEVPTYSSPQTVPTFQFQASNNASSSGDMERIRAPRTKLKNLRKEGESRMKKFFTDLKTNRYNRKQTARETVSSITLPGQETKTTIIKALKWLEHNLHTATAQEWETIHNHVYQSAIDIVDPSSPVRLAVESKLQDLYTQYINRGNTGTSSVPDAMTERQLALQDEPVRIVSVSDTPASLAANSSVDQSPKGSRMSISDGFKWLKKNFQTVSDSEWQQMYNEVLRSVSETLSPDSQHRIYVEDKLQELYDHHRNRSSSSSSASENAGLPPEEPHKWSLIAVTEGLRWLEMNLYTASEEEWENAHKTIHESIAEVMKPNTKTRRRVENRLQDLYQHYKNRSSSLSPQNDFFPDALTERQMAMIDEPPRVIAVVDSSPSLATKPDTMPVTHDVVTGSDQGMVRASSTHELRVTSKDPPELSSSPPMLKNGAPVLPLPNVQEVKREIKKEEIKEELKEEIAIQPLIGPVEFHPFIGPVMRRNHSPALGSSIQLHRINPGIARTAYFRHVREQLIGAQVYRPNNRFRNSSDTFAFFR